MTIQAGSIIGTKRLQSPCIFEVNLADRSIASACGTPRKDDHALVELRHERSPCGSGTWPVLARRRRHPEIASVVSMMTTMLRIDRSAHAVGDSQTSVVQRGRTCARPIAPTLKIVAFALEGHDIHSLMHNTLLWRTAWARCTPLLHRGIGRRGRGGSLNGSILEYHQFLEYINSSVPRSGPAYVTPSPPHALGLLTSTSASRSRCSTPRSSIHSTEPEVEATVLYQVDEGLVVPFSTSAQRKPEHVLVDRIVLLDVRRSAGMMVPAPERASSADKVLLAKLGPPRLAPTDWSTRFPTRYCHAHGSTATTLFALSRRRKGRFRRHVLGVLMGIPRLRRPRTANMRIKASRARVRRRSGSTMPA